MPDPTPTPPAADSHWEWWHTVALFLIVVLFVVMAIWRPWGPYASWIVVMIAMLAFVLVCGLGIKGVLSGAFIDERNKISLSRLQMLTWTIVALSAYGTIVIARATADPLTAMDVTMPQTIWLLMGISTTSLVGSPLIKSTKEASLAYNRKTDDASWSDLFMGEEESNSKHLDLAKIQMLFFTVLVVLSYGVMIGSLLRMNPTPDALPDVGEGMVVLLGISHGGYLAHKAVPVTKPRAVEG